MREVKLIVTTTGQVETLQTNATTWGELKAEHPTVVNDMLPSGGARIGIRETRTQIHDDGSILPTTPFSLFIAPKKTKSGASEEFKKDLTNSVIAEMGRVRNAVEQVLIKVDHLTDASKEYLMFDDVSLGVAQTKKEFRKEAVEVASHQDDDPMIDKATVGVEVKKVSEAVAVEPIDEKPAEETSFDFEGNHERLSAMTKNQLKAICKEKQIEFRSKNTKADLVEYILSYFEGCEECEEVIIPMSPQQADKVVELDQISDDELADEGKDFF